MTSRGDKVAKNYLKKKKNGVNYDKWGYMFIMPFFLCYAVFSLFPLIFTFYSSFFENYMDGLKQVGPNFVGFENYKRILADKDILKYFGNTIYIWFLGFVPQIIVSLVLAAWFTNRRLNIKGQRFFKTVIYMPNLIMASAFSMLFFTLFSDGGPINDVLIKCEIINEPIRFLAGKSTTRGLIALMNFMMWFGNTTILLMAAMLGIDVSLFEAAECDGASPGQIFRKITIPMIKPILLYVMITSMVGGIQMFDVPQILTNGEGVPNRTSMTIVMYLNKHLYSKNYGMSGAVSVIMFFVTILLSLIVLRIIKEPSQEGGK